MIQRIQSLFLLIATLISGLGSYFLYLCENTTDWVLTSKSCLVTAFLVSAIFSFVSLFLFKKRNWQLGLNKLNLFLNILLMGLFIYYLLNISGGSLDPEKGIWVFLPLLALVTLFFANRFIQKDEDLVKSVDRIR